MFLALSALTALPAAAEEEWDGGERLFGASLTVNKRVYATITDLGEAGVSFGSLLPGSGYQPEESQFNQGAISIEIGVESNVIASIRVKADDFVSGSDILPVGNVVSNTTSDIEGSVEMTTNYTTLAELNLGDSLRIWHWLKVPSNQASGRYTTSFYYEVADSDSPQL